MARPKPEERTAYPHLAEIATRWMDNDAYGHVNNAVHYSFFDTTVNAWLIARGALDVAASAVVGLVVETGCRYFAPLAYPDPVTVGLRVAHVGRSSVRYELALFGPASPSAAAQGHFVHVYVERATRRPVERLPEELRRALEPLVVSPAPESP
jgi:acyl-CoA thioester hydrolase